MKKLSLGLIDRYIIRKFLGTFFFSLVLILTIAVVFDFSEKIDEKLSAAGQPLEIPIQGNYLLYELLHPAVIASSWEHYETKE